MGIEDRDWYKEQQKEKEVEALINKLNNSSFWCKKCQGLTVNALTLICEACSADNSILYNETEGGDKL